VRPIAGVDDDRKAYWSGASDWHSSVGVVLRVGGNRRVPEIPQIREGLNSMSSMDDLSLLPDHSQGGREMAEQRKVADRLWAYSDAVFAVIVTVMVLQLRTPPSHHFSSLLGLWPTLISYVASYVFIAIIWINWRELTPEVTRHAAVTC
jgi:hypothetical protein